MDLQYHTLPNGIRIVHREVNTYVAHLGIVIGVGSRDELEKEHGMAHFIEHVLFKGTSNRKVHHILNRLENVGGDLNAFTTKEETCIYASFLSKYYSRTAELISDILVNSVFPEKEIEKEKDVIIDEINSYKDSPYEMIYDDFEDLLFEGHPLGRNILGNKKNIKKFTSGSVREFINRSYSNEQIVICSVGNTSLRRLISIAEKYFASLRFNGVTAKREKFSKISATRKTIKKRTYQTHCMLGCSAYEYNSEKRIPMALLNNLFGGPGLNSRLNMAVREKHGLAYNNESVYTPYSDAGLFTIYLGIDNGALDKTLSYVYSELKKLRKEKLGTLQLNNAKRQFIGQLAIAYESNLSQMLSMGKSMIHTNKVLELKEINKKIEDISSDDLLHIANEILDESRLSSLIYLNK